MLGNNIMDCFHVQTEHTALASFTSEASLLAGPNSQPVIPANFFGSTLAKGKRLKFHAAGIVACTGTPTYLFTARIGSTQGASDLTGTAVGVSAAITMQSGVTNRMWELILNIINLTPGQGTGNCTLHCWGSVKCFDGFASPFEYPIEPTTPPTATWTATINGAVTNYFNLSVTCSASSASNTITCKNLSAYSEN